MIGPKVLRSLLPIHRTREFRDISAHAASRPLRIEGKTPTVVCFHGFTGVPEEIRLAVDVAEELGLAATAPLLVGHGTSAAELAKTRYEDWLESARPAFDEARAKGPVILVGLSLGSLIATELALSAPGAVLGVALLSNAFWLKSPHPGASLALAGKLGLSDFYLDKEGPDLGDPVARRSHVTYDAQPLHAAVSLEQAGRRLRAELFRLHRPTLILHGARDQVCPIENSWRVAERLGTRDVRVVVYPRSHHILTRDVERDQVRAELLAFIRRVSFF